MRDRGVAPPLPRAPRRCTASPMRSPPAPTPPVNCQPRKRYADYSFGCGQRSRSGRAAADVRRTGQTGCAREVRPSQSGATIVRRETVGVVGAITPWNYPQVLAMAKVAPALAAGCTVVLKPSPETALDSYVFGDAAVKAGLPPGVLNVVLAGREAGASLVSHRGVDKIAFTGSTAAG